MTKLQETIYILIRLPLAILAFPFLLRKAFKILKEMGMVDLYTGNIPKIKSPKFLSSIWFDIISVIVWLTIIYYKFNL